jgi:hypothetical protein
MQDDLGVVEFILFARKIKNEVCDVLDSCKEL